MNQTGVRKQRKTVPPIHRFSNKVRRSETGCWEWTGCKTKSGYGKLSILTSRPVLAHRFAFEFFRYSIPEGLEIDHLCRNRGCVNPFHLQPVTRRTNIMRGVNFSALNAKKTHCPSGHPYSEENTYWCPSGYRQCITCRKIHHDNSRSK